VALTLLQICAVVLGVLLLVVYARLGFFLIPTVGLGAAAALFVTRVRWTAVRPRTLGAVAVVVAYAGTTWLAWASLVGRRSERVVTMRWESRGRAHDFDATEVVLHFVDYPGHFVGEYSDDLAAGLEATGRNPVEVTFRVTTDLGRCVRGFRVSRVGDIASWHAAWGYAGASGTAPSPWRSPWWCP